jgi:hypothetical protein
MPKVDDYRAAVELGRAALADRAPKRLADQSGAQFVPDSEGGAVLTLSFLNRRVAITWPAFEFSFEAGGGEVPLQQQILLLHYLRGAAGEAITGDWIAYQEVPDGKFYLGAFQRRAKIPMMQTFGERPELLVKLATEVYGAVPFDQGDAAVVVRALPLVPVALILWRGDDEFSPDGNIIFDRSISGMLSAEDIAWLAGMIVYPLMGMARGM